MPLEFKICGGKTVADERLQKLFVVTIVGQKNVSSSFTFFSLF